MESAGYVTLGRQSGLLREMQVVANNIANAPTVGFRREGVVFSEFVQRAGSDPSVSMALGNARHLDLTQGGLTQTGGAYDFAIQGEGFFLIETPDGSQLTRAGAFTPGPDGALVTLDGHRLLDGGGSPVTIPAGVGRVTMGADGTLSAGGQPIARIGVWLPVDPLRLRQTGSARLDGGEVVPAEGATLVQGALEESNVDPIAELSRMIEVQRAYEMGQGFLDREDERMRGMIRTLGG